MELLQQQNLCQEKAIVHELDAATQTDSRQQKTEHFAENDVLQDAATQTIHTEEAKPKVMMDRSTAPVSHSKEHMPHPGMDSDVGSALQRYIRKDVALFLILCLRGQPDGRKGPMNGVRSLAWQQNRILHLERTLERMDRELQQERNEVIKLCSENLRLTRCSALGPSIPAILPEYKNQVSSIVPNRNI